MAASPHTLIRRAVFWGALSILIGSWGLTPTPAHSATPKMTQPDNHDKADTILRPLSPVIDRVSRGGRTVSLYFDDTGALAFGDSAAQSRSPDETPNIPSPDIPSLGSDIALSDDGQKLALSISGNSASYATLWVEGREIEAGRWFDSEPIFNADGDVFWVRRDFTRKRPRRPRTRIFMLPGDKIGTASLKTVTPPSLISHMMRWGDDVVAVGYNEMRETYDAFLIRKENGRPQADLILRQETPLIVRDGRLYSVALTGNVHRHFWSLLAASGPASHEPMLFSDNRFGRLSWHQSNRIRLFANLAKNSDDPEIIDHLQRKVSRILDGADAAGRYPATKYSPDRKTSQRANVLDGTIYSSLWNAYPVLDPASQDRLRAATLKMLTDVELSWTGEFYSYPKDDENARARILPFNQQNTIGTVMAQYALATGDTQFNDRVTKLRANLLAEAFDEEDGLSWRYWPERHWAGNMPDHQKERREDTGHASLNAEFLMLADAALANAKGDTSHEMILPKTLFSAKLGDGPLRYPRNITWDTRTYRLSIYWAPTVRWGRLPELEPLYQKWIMLPREDYDVQQVLAGYAERLPELNALHGTIEIAELTPQESGETPLSAAALKVFDVSIGQKKKRPEGAPKDTDQPQSNVKIMRALKSAIQSLDDRPAERRQD